jgi:hypothetical protein
MLKSSCLEVSLDGPASPHLNVGHFVSRPTVPLFVRNPRAAWSPNPYLVTMEPIHAVFGWLRRITSYEILKQT